MIQGRIYYQMFNNLCYFIVITCLFYCSLKALMVIAICETKEEDTESQILFWNHLNDVMDNLGYPKPHFAGFMADEAGANWNAIRTVYNGGPENILVGRERSCLFHWEQSLQKHTKKYVLPAYRRKHVELCEKWRLAETEEHGQLQASSIQNWWTKGCVLPENIKAMKRWFDWWKFRILHWGSLNEVKKQ